MSAIAGVYCRDGSAAGTERLAAVSRRLVSMGPDGEQVAASGPVAMAHRLFRTYSTGSSDESLAVGTDGALVTFDGSLHNADDVRRAVTAQHTHSDPQLVRAAYRQYGLKGLAGCVGDFALALWEATTRTLVLCCDGLGRRPLFYRITRETVLWASSARALVEGAGLSTALDEEHIADFLANVTSGRSPFAAVTRLQGGHALIVGPSRAEVVRYWSFDPTRSIRYRDDRDYEQHFVELFQAAVACRLDTIGPAFAELSGGLDSGSVTCVASRLVDRNVVPCPALRTVSYVYDCSRSADERPFIQAVELFIGRRGLHILESEHALIDPAHVSGRPEWPSNGLCMLAQANRVTAEMRLTGSRVLLSGLGGDHVLWSQPNVAVILADLLVDRRFGALLRDALRWSRFLKLPVTQLLAEAGQIARYKQYRERVAGAGWLTPGFVTRTHFRDRKRQLQPEAAAFGLPTQALQCQAILSAMRPYALEPCSTIGYVDRRYPFLDRRVAEFALAIPVDQKVRLGESRSILRRALRGQVPDTVLHRRTKAGPDEAFIRALSRERHSLTALFRDPRVCAYGIVDHGALHAAVTRATHGGSSDHPLLIRTLSLELWLRTLDEPSSASEATAPPGWRDLQTQEDPNGPERQPERQHAGGSARLVRNA